MTDKPGKTKVGAFELAGPSGVEPIPAGSMRTFDVIP